MHAYAMPKPLIPAKAGIQWLAQAFSLRLVSNWIPAFAGMSGKVPFM
jgi:hypothetical protein